MKRVGFAAVLEMARKGAFGDLHITRSDGSVLRGPIEKISVDRDALIIKVAWSAWRLRPAYRWFEDPEVYFSIDSGCFPNFDEEGWIDFIVPDMGQVKLMLHSDGSLTKEDILPPVETVELPSFLRKTKGVPFRKKIASRFS